MTVPGSGVDSYKTRPDWWPETVCYHQLSLRVSLENLRKGKAVECIIRQNEDLVEKVKQSLKQIETFRFQDENEYRGKINLQSLSRILLKQTPRKASFQFFTPEKLARLFLLKEIKTSPDRQKITFLPFYDILANTCSGMTTTITFPSQNDGGLSARVF